MKKILCFFNLHSFKDRVLFDYKNATLESVPCIMREECERCGKIRNEVKGSWSWKDWPGNKTGDYLDEKERKNVEFRDRKGN